MATTNKQRIIWIDAVKFFAVTAVLLDHTYGTLYNDDRIRHLTFFSVSVFIIVMGITSYNSCVNGTYNVKKKIWGIFRPYLAATFIYCIFEEKFFYFDRFLNKVVYFNAAPPFYFVLLYIQMAVIIPVIYYLVIFSSHRKQPILWEILFLIIIIIISAMTTNRTDILSIYGGGGKLFGGTYLFLLYVGMWFSKYFRKNQFRKVHQYVLLFLAASLTMIWQLFIYKNSFALDTHFPFGPGINPPGITLSVYAMLVILTFYAAGTVLENSQNGLFLKVFTYVSILGKHTLYIFLYHFFIIENILSHTKDVISFTKGTINFIRIIYLATMIFGSIFIEYVIEYLYKKTVACYHRK